MVHSVSWWPLTNRTEFWSAFLTYSVIKRSRIYSSNFISTPRRKRKTMQESWTSTNSSKTLHLSLWTTWKTARRTSILRKLNSGLNTNSCSRYRPNTCHHRQSEISSISQRLRNLSLRLWKAVQNAWSNSNQKTMWKAQQKPWRLLQRALLMVTKPKCLRGYWKKSEKTHPCQTSKQRRLFRSCTWERTLLKPQLKRSIDSQWCHQSVTKGSKRNSILTLDRGCSLSK